MVSPNTTPSTVLPILPIDAANLQSSEVKESPPKEITSSISEDFTNTTRSTAPGSETPSPPSDRLLSTTTPPAADPRAEISSAENALQLANEAMTTMNLSDTWEGALERIKWVMDTVSPVAEVRHDDLLSVLG
jgi:hypothetical protein